MEPDERLRITDVRSGSYDAKLTDLTGRVCVVRGIRIEAGAIFSIEEKELISWIAEDSSGLYVPLGTVWPFEPCPCVACAGDSEWIA